MGIFVTNEQWWYFIELYKIHDVYIYTFYMASEKMLSPRVDLKSLVPPQDTMDKYTNNTLRSLIFASSNFRETKKIGFHEHLFSRIERFQKFREHKFSRIGK